MAATLLAAEKTPSLVVRHPKQPGDIYNVRRNFNHLRLKQIPCISLHPILTYATAFSPLPVLAAYSDC